MWQYLKIQSKQSIFNRHVFWFSCGWVKVFQHSKHTEIWRNEAHWNRRRLNMLVHNGRLMSDNMYKSKLVREKKKKRQKRKRKSVHMWLADGRCWWLTVKADLLTPKVTFLHLVRLKILFLYLQHNEHLHMLMLLSVVFCIYFVLVEVLSMKCHLL